MELERFKTYSRKDIHDIFSPDTKFTRGSGYWGISGIIKVPETENDFIFLVTYGKKQSEHEFDEEIDENGILVWQSQVQQNLKTPQIQKFINHDHTKNNIYLFLRTDDKSDYTYLGLLAYISHDNQRENPVYFKWQILEWDNYKEIPENIKDYSIEYEINEKEFNLELNSDSVTYYVEPTREGKGTKDFYNNRNVNFEGEIRKNSELGRKGEDVVVEYEKLMLIKNGREDLAEKVAATRTFAGNAERFDVRSFEIDGKEKYIEVKTTRGALSNKFHISESEVEFSQEHAENYYLYRVYNFDIKTMSADLKIIKGAVNREKLVPTNYSCRIM